VAGSAGGVIRDDMGMWIVGFAINIGIYMRQYVQNSPFVGVRTPTREQKREEERSSY